MPDIIDIVPPDNSGTDASSEPDPTAAGLVALLRDLKTAIIDIGDKSESIAYDPTFPAEAITALANRPLAAQMSEYARAVADAMHRSSPDDVEQWTEMPHSERKLLTDGIKGLLDSGYCIVPEEVVTFSRGAARRINELESKLKRKEESNEQATT